MLEVPAEIGALSQVPIMSADPSGRFKREILLGGKPSSQVEAAPRP